MKTIINLLQKIDLSDMLVRFWIVILLFGAGISLMAVPAKKEIAEHKQKTEQMQVLKKQIEDGDLHYCEACKEFHK